MTLTLQLRGKYQIFLQRVHIKSMSGLLTRTKENDSVASQEALSFNSFLDVATLLDSSQYIQACVSSLNIDNPSWKNTKGRVCMQGCMEQ